MKLLQSLAILSLSSLFVTNSAIAVEKIQANQKPAQASTQAPKKDVKLEQFNKNVGVRFIERGLQQNENNQSVITLTYTIENKGKNKIKSLNWISAYEVNNEAFYLRDIPINFEPALDSGKKINVTITIPVSELPKQARQLFTSKEAHILAVNGAKNVTFSNGKKIVVSK